MGMFDSINIKMLCPYCGEESEMEAQTKELDCSLNVYNVGDFVDDKYNYLDCIADCHSKECLEHENKIRGYVSGFGRLFHVKIYLEDGKVSGRYTMLDNTNFEVI